ncbi:MAG: ChaN family lipoprotein, partial [Burkholderiaceae bacterium]|nr:ChaN family lipoprotein [Burkholderiaceae bacterium]
MIEQARPARGWDWRLYRPFVELALEYELPIVAANLSRADAMRVAAQGFAAAFDEATRRRVALDALPPALLAAHEKAVDDGHCNRLPAEALPSMARAQIARDLALAEAIRPHIARGVVLLTGNGHARRDIGVPFFLGESERAQAVAIGLLERDK